MGSSIHFRNKRRYPVANGIFYPDSEESLSNQLSSWGLKKGQSCTSCGGRVIIAPHGAWDVTGKAGGIAFSSLQMKQNDSGKPVDSIILLAGDPYSDHDGIFLSESSYFETPLGQIAVDKAKNKKISTCSTLIKINDIPHLMEHSIEVLLPMVKYCFPNAKIVPILISGRKPVLISALARAIRIVFEKDPENTLFIVSSNVAQDENPQLASSMAGDFCALIKKMDSSSFLSCLKEGRISASGCIPIAALMESGLLAGKSFSALCPLSHSMGDLGLTVYYGAFSCNIKTRREL